MLETSGAKITGTCLYLDVERLFPLFDLPPRLPAELAVMRARLVKSDEFSADRRSK